MLSRLVIVFLPRSKCLLISWLQSPSAVILEPKKIKSVTVSIVSPSICHEVLGPDAMILVFWMLSFKPAFSLSPFTFIKSFPSFFLLSAIRVVSPACGDGGGLVAKPCLTLYDPMDCSLPGPPVHGILQARILEWVAISFFRGSSQLRNWTQISCLAGGFFTIRATRKAHSKVYIHIICLLPVYKRSRFNICNGIMEVIYRHVFANDPYLWEWADILANV